MQLVNRSVTTSSDDALEEWLDVKLGAGILIEARSQGDATQGAILDAIAKALLKDYTGPPPTEVEGVETEPEANKRAIKAVKAFETDKGWQVAAVVDIKGVYPYPAKAFQIYLKAIHVIDLSKKPVLDTGMPTPTPKATETPQVQPEKTQPSSPTLILTLTLGLG